MTLPATPQRKSLTRTRTQCLTDTTVTWPQILTQIQIHLNPQYRSQILNSLLILLFMACSHLPHRYPLQLVSFPTRRQLTSLASSTTSIGSSTHPLFLQITNRNLPLFTTNPLRRPNFPHYHPPASSNSSNAYPHGLSHPHRQVSCLLETNQSFQVPKSVLTI